MTCSIAGFELPQASSDDPLQRILTAALAGRRDRGTDSIGARLLRLDSHRHPEVTRQGASGTEAPGE